MKSEISEEIFIILYGLNGFGFRYLVYLIPSFSLYFDLQI